MPLPDFSPYLPASLIQSRPVAAEQVELVIEPPTGFLAAHQRPGQFCKIRVGDREGIFAMLSAPGEPEARFLVRVGVPVGGEAADALASLPPGSAIEMTQPAGVGFDLSRAEGRDIYFVATGTGLAPIRAAIEVVLAEPEAFGALYLDVGLRSEAHLPFGADFERWRAAGVDVVISYSAPGADGTLRGQTVQQALFARGSRFDDAAIVAVGQTEMVADLRAKVVEAGGLAERFLVNL